MGRGRRRCLTNVALPPGLVLIVAGLILPALPVRARQAVLLVAPLLALAMVWLVPDGPALSVSFLGYDLVLCDGDPLSRFFGTVFAIVAFGGALYALNQTNVVELAAAFSTPARRSAWSSPAI